MATPDDVHGDVLLIAYREGVRTVRLRQRDLSGMSTCSSEVIAQWQHHMCRRAEPLRSQ